EGEGDDGADDGSGGEDGDSWGAGSDGAFPTDDDPPGDPVAANGLPCDVLSVLAENCFECHSDTPSFGAPMALADYDAMHVPAPSDLVTPTFEMVAARVDDPVRPMPPIKIMDEADKAVLRAWIDAGAPEDPDADCGSVEPPPVDPVGPQALDCEVTDTFTAHAPGSNAGFQVPTQGAENLYQCFAFQTPYDIPTQATAWAPIIDDARVVHHWILYRNRAPNTDGGVFPCDAGLQLEADFVAGWAPGGQNMTMPDGVGLQLAEAGDWFILQIHYNNSAHYNDVVDSSGVAFCAADSPRTDTAGILSVGTVGIDIPANTTGHQEVGTCGWLGTIGWPAELHVIGGSPHMHQYGRGLTTELLRGGNAGQEMITNVPNFTFENQGMHLNEPEVIIHPGDRLRTTCTFDNPNPFRVGFGEATGDEMCFNFMLVYPIQQIHNRNCGIVF
ncbi:MAG: hypothetical protein JKY37_23260, partial [Nannocystaceae bacterium]|nr:hypothetical protein [Nannocystaceae bacterium]